MWGFVPKGKNLYEYYKTLPEKVQYVPPTKEMFVDGLFGQLTLWALIQIFEQDKGKIKMDKEEIKQLEPKIAKLEFEIEKAEEIKKPQTIEDLGIPSNIMKKGVGQEKPKGRLKKFFKRLVGGTGRESDVDYIKK
jgi:hypothetical protein